MIQIAKARAELTDLFAEKELYIAFYEEKDQKGIRKRFDEYRSFVEKTLKYKIIFCESTFNSLWSENTFEVFSSKSKAKQYNTASILIDEVLREFGKRHGYLSS